MSTRMMFESNHLELIDTTSCARGKGPDNKHEAQHSYYPKAPVSKNIDERSSKDLQRLQCPYTCPGSDYAG